MLMNIKFQLYRSTEDNSEVCIENDTNLSSSPYNKVRVYYDGKYIYEESILVDGIGNEYYQIRNPYCENGSFANRPKDAVKAISEGYGDVFVRNECLGTGNAFETVYRYIDRNYGELVRTQTLGVFDDAKFEYVVRLNLKGAKSGIYYIDRNHQLTENSDEANYFSDENEAIKYKDMTLKAAKTNFNKLKRSITGPTDATGLFTWLNDSEFGKDGTYNSNHIVYAVFFAMLQEWQEDKKNSFSLEAVQTIKS